MTNEDAIKWLVGIKERTIADLPKEAIDLAIKALETGEVYMTGEDYNLYMKGYKAGKKDFEPKQGEWITGGKDVTGQYFYDEFICNQCFVVVTDKSNFCPKCGADMQKGGKEE